MRNRVSRQTQDLGSMIGKFQINLEIPCKVLIWMWLVSCLLFFSISLSLFWLEVPTMVKSLGWSTLEQIPEITNHLAYSAQYLDVCWLKHIVLFLSSSCSLDIWCVNQSWDLCNVWRGRNRWCIRYAACFRFRLRNYRVLCLCVWNSESGRIRFAEAFVRIALGQFWERISACSSWRGLIEMVLTSLWP